MEPYIVISSSFHIISAIILLASVIYHHANGHPVLPFRNREIFSSTIIIVRVVVGVCLLFDAFKDHLEVLMYTSEFFCFLLSTIYLYGFASKIYTWTIRYFRVFLTIVLAPLCLIILFIKFNSAVLITSSTQITFSFAFFTAYFIALIIDIRHRSTGTSSLSENHRENSSLKVFVALLPLQFLIFLSMGVVNIVFVKNYLSNIRCIINGALSLSIPLYSFIFRGPISDMMFKNLDPSINVNLV